MSKPIAFYRDDWGANPGCLHCKIEPLVSARLKEEAIQQVIGELAQTVAELIASGRTRREREIVWNAFHAILAQEYAADLASFREQGKIE